VPYFNDALDPGRIWGIYRSVSFEDKYQEVSAPAVFVAGWYDMFLGPQLKDFVRLRSEGQGAAKDSVLIVGPWGHGQGGDGSVDFGPEAEQKKVLGPRHVVAWFDHWLKGADNEVLSWPRVRLFIMGDNVWRDESEWPLARTRYTKFYLHSAGRANTRHGDGTLSLDPPSGFESSDHFTYDPLQPVPTRGGNNLGLNLGAYDQAQVEDRDDVLCYTSAILDQDLEVTGPITATLWAVSDAVDTAFTVKLVDVYPNGKAVNIQDGIARALYRSNDPEQPTPLTPGAVERYEFDLWATANVFKAGHRVRVEVSSSNFPRFNRSLNTGEPALRAAVATPAHQTIVHDSEHPSHLVLPVIPR
jgi:putative CocE/NonD family hydrolase